MKTVFIEGFKVETNLDEQDVFNRIFYRSHDCQVSEAPDDIVCEELSRELAGGTRLMDFVEKVGIDGMPCADYYYDVRIGYRDKRLEPFYFRANKGSLKMEYTGAMGGQPWSAKVYI